ncbi:ABC transporter ATP-binding protein, partial [Streptomyces sp. AV19]|uniref:ABC transporter ATP-binding protein n=1 Tax=Streptomyces sp. AV19 TaxID=2793068 RepID=UPI001A29F867
MTAHSEPSGSAARRSPVRSLLRLWPFVRPARGRLAASLAVTVVASSTSLVIPLALKQIVDGPIADRDPSGVWLGGLAILVLGLLEAGLFGLRRMLVARPLAEVEAAMRSALYRHLQRLPVAFHDRWPSGQLLSRATTDLMLLRIFLAFVVTFLVVNGLTITVGFVILLLQRWTLGLVLLAPVVPLVILCHSFEERYTRAARTAQDRLGDLTTVVEESVLGIRVTKGFGRHRAQERAFAALTARLRATELHKAGLLGVLWALIMILPELAIGTALVLGVRQVADGTLTAGALVAFLSTALALRWPVESMGFLLAVANESATATERYFEVLDAEAPGAGAAPEGAGRTAPGPGEAPSAGARGRAIPGTPAAGAGESGVPEAAPGTDAARAPLAATGELRAAVRGMGGPTPGTPEGAADPGTPGAPTLRAGERPDAAPGAGRSP